MKEYYKILGLNNENCSSEEIKKAYKKTAMKWHPDRNQDNKEKAEKKFKEINTAYTVLSDSNKKNIYDKYGEEGLKNEGFAGNNINPMDIFGDIFGSSGFSFNFGSNFSSNFNSNNNRKRKNKPIIKNISVKLEDLYNGKKLKLSITRKIIDNEKKHLIKECSICNGNGIVIEVRQMGPMIQQIQQQCSKCNGSGRFVPKNIMNSENKIVELNIKKGSKHGDKIIIEDMGDTPIDGSLPSDIVFIINQENHSIFNVSDKHLIIEKNINLIDSLSGFEFIIKHLDGRELLVSVDNIIKPDDIKVIKYQGMPCENSNDGDLLIKFNVIFPNSIKNVDLLSKVLEKSNLEKVNVTDNLINTHLTDFNSNNYNQQHQEQPGNCNQQ